jgi:PAS domain S-box-containing protein
LRVRASHGSVSTGIQDFSGRLDESIIGDLRQHLKVAPPRQLVSVPVVVNGSISGLLAVVRESPLAPEEHRQFLALADQAAIALNSARPQEIQTREALRQRDESLAALRESNQRINKILESITDLFYHLDREWRFTDMNRRAEALLGKERDELLGQVIWDVLPDSIGSPFHAQLLQAMDQRVALHFEVESLRRPTHWFEGHAYPSGNGLFVYLNDISERKRAEIATRQLAAIVESSNDAIIGKDLDGIITSWNKGAERIFGYTAEEAKGRPVTILIPAGRLDEEDIILGQIRRGEPLEHYETVRQRKDGSLVEISLTVSPIKDEDGKIVGASKIARDTSERRRVEAEVRFQAHLLNAVEQAVIATDLNGIILYWNSFAEWLYGWSEAEAIGANILDLTPVATMRERAAEILARLSEGDSWSGEFLVQRKDGSAFPAMVTDSPIFSAQGELIGMVGVSLDVTESKRKEEERAQLHESERQARAEAERANALKDEFLATLSHELRNPLNVILGYSEVLLRSSEARQSQFLTRVAETLKRNALAQSQLVRDLLDFSRLRMGKLSLNREAVSVITIVNQAVQTVRAEAAAKNIELKVEANDESLFVDADPLRLEQVVWNLLNNSVKFTPRGGTVTIRFEREKQEAVLIVEDTGQGIDPEFMPHVFEMFRQADASSSRRHSGMGIGLALVAQLVELHGGTVAATSAGPGKGARFTFTIPLSRETKESATPIPKVVPDALSQLRILLVDDSADTVDMLQRLFEMDGATVSTARSGVEALQKAREKVFDVILSDISMPEMDGFEFLRNLREIPEKRDTPVLALTGFGRAEDIERAVAEGFFSHVTKPLDVDALVEILRKLPIKEDSLDTSA